MTSANSLRDLYSPQSPPWSFLPADPTSHNSSPSSSHQWSTRPNRSPLFDLAPALDIDSATDARSLAEASNALLLAALAQYISTAIAMPWEVGKMLLQVQWVPKDTLSDEQEPEGVAFDDVDDGELSDDSIDNDSYFADPTSTSSPASSRYVAPRQADEQGYIVRRSVLEEGTRPEYIIPVGSADGAWGMIKRVSRFRGEGWLALWKGLLTSFITDALSSNLQPLLHNVLESILLPSITPFHQPPLYLPVISHVMVGFILSPLDLIRTRLIVQSFMSRHQTYTGPLDALAKIARHEGGIAGMYLHPHLLYPTLLDAALRPLVSLALPGMLTSLLGPQINQETNPVMWAFAELGGSCAGLLITLPFETVRRRLQVQVRGSAKPLKACVETRPAPYNGVVDTMWHILTEERSDLPVKRRSHRWGKVKGKGKEKAKGTEHEGESIDETEGWMQSTGLGQLYRGLGMRIGASVIVFLLGVFSGTSGDEGWAEL